MLRITTIDQTPAQVVLAVAGWLCREQVALLEQEGAKWANKANRLVIDLNGVQFIDAAGVALLRRWAEEGTRICGGSIFVQMMLKGQ